MEKILQISGEGRILVLPEIAVVNFPLESLDYEYDQAIANLNQVVSNLKIIFEKHGIEEQCIRTRNFLINKQKEKDLKSGSEHFKGYRASLDISVSMVFNHTLLKNVLSDIAQEINEGEFHLRFKPSNSGKCRNEALEKAIDHAVKTASLIARKMGLTLSGIRNIDYSCSSEEILSPEFVLFLTRESDMYYANIEAEEVNVVETIDITWSIQESEEEKA